MDLETNLSLDSYRRCGTISLPNAFGSYIASHLWPMNGTRKQSPHRGIEAIEAEAFDLGSDNTYKSASLPRKSGAAPRRHLFSFSFVRFLLCSYSALQPLHAGRATGTASSPLLKVSAARMQQNSSVGKIISWTVRTTEMFFVLLLSPGLRPRRV